MNASKKPLPIIKRIPVEFISRCRYQPRKKFDSTLLQELAESIKSQGVLQPLLVREISENRYELVMGERRWRAAQLASLEEVPCLVDFVTDKNMAEMALIENIQREDLNPIEEAEGLKRIIDLCGYLHEEAAAVIGKSREKVTNLLRLLNLHDKVKNYLIEKLLTEGHGKLLAGLDHPSQLMLAEQTMKYGWSVRKLEQAIKNHKEPRPKKIGNEPNIEALEKLMSEQLGTKVQVEPDGGYLSGELKIKFYSNETLAGILDRLGIKYND